MTSPAQKPPAPNAQNISALLEKYTTRLFALLIAFFCFLLFYFGPQLVPSYKDVFIAVSTSLFSSLIFALVYSSVVESHHLNAVNDQLSKSVEQAVDQMTHLQQDSMQKITDSTLAKIEEIERSFYHEISQHFRELIPTESFRPTNQPDQRFNDVLNGALTTSRQYLFKGVTGRYIPSRLAKMEHHNLNCKILLVNPLLQDLLRLYVRDRFGTNLSNEEVAQRVQNVKKEIYMTVVDLFDQAHKISLDLRIYEGPIFYRTEIFDEQIFISYFTAKTSTAFPMTYLYENKSFFYDAFLTDFNQTFELSSVSAIFNSRSTEPDLLAFLTKIGCDTNEVPQLRKEAEQFRQDFLKRV